MRKHPRQRRSRQLVDSLIEATGRALVEYGLDHTTTVRIAEIAGVSVGSLYQYFEGKDALVEALMDKLADDIAQGLRRLPLADSAGLRETVDGAIRFGFAVLHSRDGLYLELVRNWHRLLTNRVADALQQHGAPSSILPSAVWLREDGGKRRRARACPPGSVRSHG